MLCWLTDIGWVTRTSLACLAFPHIAEAASRKLEEATVQMSTAASCSKQGSNITCLFNLSLLKYQDRDALVEAFQKYRQKVCTHTAVAGSMGSCSLIISRRPWARCSWQIVE